MNKQKVKKILKIAIVIILVIMLIFLINTFRKFLIIKQIIEKEESISSTNYNINYSKKCKDKEIIKTEYYTKDGKWLFKIKSEEDGMTNYEYKLYNNGNVTNFYSETSKTVKLDYRDSNTLEPTYLKIGFTNIDFNNFYGAENEGNLEIFLLSMKTSVRQEKYNNKECYVISESFDELKIEHYIEKDTGLCLRDNFSKADNSILEEGMTEYQEWRYEFDNVSDEIFLEPNINEYKILEND